MRYLKRGIAAFLVAPMAPSAQPAMAATQLIGEFTLDKMIVPLGEILPMEGYVASFGSGLAQITYQIDGWLGEDDNNRYCTQETWGKLPESCGIAESCRGWNARAAESAGRIHAVAGCAL